MNQIWSNWENYIILFLLVWALVDDEANPSVYVNIQAESLHHSFSPIYLIRSIFSLCTVSEGWRVHFARIDFDDAASQEGSVLCFLCCGQYAIDQKRVHHLNMLRGLICWSWRLGHCWLQTSWSEREFCKL